MSDEVDSEIKSITEEERSGFDLRARLQSRALREDEIVIYTDDVTAEKLGDARDDVNRFGVVVGRFREGVLGEIDALADGEDRSALEAQAAELRRELESTAFEFSLHAVPEIAVKAARREARKLLNIKGKVPESLEEEYGDALTALMCTRIVAGLKDRATGDSKARVTYQEARDLSDYLSSSEWLRLVQAINEVQFKQAVGDQVTSDPHFSQAG